VLCSSRIGNIAPTWHRVSLHNTWTLAHHKVGCQKTRQGLTIPTTMQCASRLRSTAPARALLWRWRAGQQRVTFACKQMPPQSRRDRVRRLVSKQHRSQELGASKPPTLLVGFYGPCTIHALSYHGPQKQRHPCPQPNFSLLQKRTTSLCRRPMDRSVQLASGCWRYERGSSRRGTMPSLSCLSETPLKPS
jgi:hypothetical protein